MKPARVFLTVAIAALAIAFAPGTHAVAAGQHVTGGPAPTGASPSGHGQATRPTPPPQPPFVTPTSGPTPFPNIATLSGPLPGTVNGAPTPPSRDLFRTRTRQFNTWSPYLYPGFAYGGGYAYGDATGAPGTGAPPAPEPPMPTGLLRFDVTPGSAQVFVDGFYAGTVDDIGNRRGLTLPEGPHRIELRAGGYAPSTFDVVVPREGITYRGMLDAERTQAAAARGSSTFYVIPGCYMGNVPPRPERVGPGCDVRQVRVIAPYGPGTSGPAVRNARPGAR